MWYFGIYRLISWIRILRIVLETPSSDFIHLQLALEKEELIKALMAESSESSKLKVILICTLFYVMKFLLLNGGGSSWVQVLVFVS